MSESGGSDGEGELLRLHGRLRLEPDAPAIHDAVLLRELGNQLPQRLRLLLAEVRAAAVEAFVAVELLRPILREVVEKMLARPRPHEQEVGPDAAGARRSGRSDDLLE